MGEDELTQAEKPGDEGTEAITTGWQFTGLLGALRGGALVIRKSRSRHETRRFCSRRRTHKKTDMRSQRPELDRDPSRCRRWSLPASRATHRTGEVIQDDPPRR
jgi:hypothetical protein